MNRMLEWLENARNSQCCFASDASYEMRSPLTSIGQHAEVTLANPDRVTAAELAEVVLAEQQRMQRRIELCGARGPVGRARSPGSSATRMLTKVDANVNRMQTVAVIELSEQTIIDQVVQRLSSAYPGVELDIVTAVVNRVYAGFDGRPVRDYVPLLVERHARLELVQLGDGGTRNT